MSHMQDSIGRAYIHPILRSCLQPVLIVNCTVTPLNKTAMYLRDLILH